MYRQTVGSGKILLWSAFYLAGIVRPVERSLLTATYCIRTVWKHYARKQSGLIRAFKSGIAHCCKTFSLGRGRMPIHFDELAKWWSKPNRIPPRKKLPKGLQTRLGEGGGACVRRRRTARAARARYVYTITASRYPRRALHCIGIGSDGRK